MPELNGQADREPTHSGSLEEIMVAFYFIQAYKTFMSAFEKMIRPWDLNPSQCMTLLFLRFFDSPLTASRIARLLSLETHSVTSLLDGLQKKKLVKRRRSRTDRRVIEVALTDNGRQVLKEIRRPYQEFAGGILTSQFPEEQLRAFSGMMQKIRDAGNVWQGIDPEKATIIADKFSRGLQSAADPP
jgi:DNA-binding MarR family transcriptional regulator